MIYEVALRGNHAAYFLFLFLHGLLAVPLMRHEFESAPLFFCRPRSSRNNVAVKERKVWQMSENLTYEELIKRNRAEKQARDMALRKSLLIKLAIRATIAVVCSGIAFVAWKRYEAKKQREAELVAIEIRRQEEVAQKEREKRRIEEEAAAKQREQERIEQLRKIDEERVARERKREEERMAWERKCEEERMARELEMAEKLRKKEEERLRLEKERIALSRRIEEERQEREKATAHNQVQRQTANANTQNGLASRPTKKNASDEQYNLAFFNIRSRMGGGSILEPLVKRLNDIEDDRMKHAVSRTARMVAMSAIAGRIGPVNYHRMIKTKTVTSTQNIGTFYGQTQGGSLISGDVYGPVSRTRTKVGGYVCEVPNGFKSAFDQMSSLGRKGHARANAEVASCIFVDAAKGMIGMDERKSLQLFEGAANAGDAEAMFMQAFCLFYGIGTQSNNSNTANAYRVLLGWEQHADSESLRNSGWAKRRLSEAHKCFRE